MSNESVCTDVRMADDASGCSDRSVGDTERSSQSAMTLIQLCLLKNSDTCCDAITCALAVTGEQGGCGSGPAPHRDMWSISGQMKDGIVSHKAWVTWFYLLPIWCLFHVFSTLIFTAAAYTYA